MKSLRNLIVAADFFTVEVWTAKRLKRFVVLFLIDLASRRVEIGGISRVANGSWTKQIARNLTDSVDGLLAGKRYLIHDRDSLFTQEFSLHAEGRRHNSVRLPARSPNLNVYAERFVRSIKESCLEPLILFERVRYEQLSDTSFPIIMRSATTRACAIGSFNRNLTICQTQIRSNAENVWAER